MLSENITTIADARGNFDSALEALGGVHTREELEVVQTRLKEAREALWELDPEFRNFVKENQRRNKIIRDEERAKHKAKIAEAESMASGARMKAEAARRTAERHLDSPAPPRGFKVLTPDEAEAKADTRMICPICGASGRGNMVNGTPTCCHDTGKHGPWHRLVPEDDLRRYNRAYRRRWKNA